MMTIGTMVLEAPMSDVYTAHSLKILDIVNTQLLLLLKRTLGLILDSREEFKKEFLLNWI